MRNHPRALLLALALLPLAVGTGCGGGGGGGGDATITFQPTTAVSIQAGGAVDNSAGLKVGQIATIGSVACLRFGVFPFLDQNDTIVSAKLRLRQVSVTGSPYPAFGNVVVDLMDFGASLGAGDQAAPVLTSALGILSSDATLGFKEVDVTTQVAAAAAANQFTIDFRARFTGVVLQPTVDLAYFEDAANGLASGGVPELIVNYH